MATKIVLDGNKATGIEFSHEGKTHTVNVSKEVVLSAGVIQSPQLLELSGIGDPEVLKAAGVELKVENNRVGKNFQDHVLGGMLYNLADGLTSLDSLHGAEYAKAQEAIYRKTNRGPYGSPGMLMGFVSYASLVDQETLDRTIADVREHSTAETEFEKAQEDLIVKQLADPTFANIQTFCEHIPHFLT
jgi:choline dehydrogenase-like flavoprotein